MNAADKKVDSANLTAHWIVRSANVFVLDSRSAMDPEANPNG